MKTKKIASIIFIVASISWGCNSGEQKSTVNEQVQQKEQVKKAPTQQKTTSGEVDKFGRKPGEQHYGHNHSSTEKHGSNPATTPQKPASGEPDKFGRKPGDQHYGHNHQ